MGAVRSFRWRGGLLGFSISYIAANLHRITIKPSIKIQQILMTAPPGKGKLLETVEIKLVVLLEF